MTGYRDYLKAVYRETGYLATWPPSMRLEVGQVIRRRDGRVQPETTLDELLAEAELAAPLTVGIQESDPSTETMKGAAARTVDGHAGVGGRLAHAAVQFGKDREFLVATAGARDRYYASMGQVRRALRHLHQRRLWQEDFHLVWWVQSAEHSAVVISQGRSSSVEASARLPVPTPDGAWSAADVGTALESSPLSSYASWATNRTPFHQAIRLRRFRTTDVDTRPLRGEDDNDEVSIDPVGEDDLFGPEPSTTEE